MVDLVHSAEFGGRGTMSVAPGWSCDTSLRGSQRTLDFRSAVASYALIVELLDFLFLGR